ncbi:MAG: glycosyltransferase [Porphyromonadaceae bacterium]|nr:glycosyltransferase [Porphyromonadaceae bacterium]
MELKVLQLGKFHPVKGGVEKVMMAFVRGLSTSGVYCDMLCASADDEVGETRLNSHSKIIKTKTIANKSATMISPDMISKLREICHDYHIIHIHHPDPMATLALFLSDYKGKVILHWHSDILKQRFLLKLYMPLQKWLINRADLILGTTPTYVQESPYLADVQDKTSYLPIGVRERVADDSVIATIRNEYAGKKIVYSMGRLVAYKGYEHLINAAAMLDDSYVVLIGGSGPLKASLQRQVADLGLSEKVRILGFIPSELEAAYYAACDLFCLSSTIKTEAYAIVQVEAMSVGRPIIATNIEGSGVPWVNAHGESGVNVTPGNAREIANAIHTICSSPELYNQLSQGARKRYLELFTREKMQAGLLDQYRRIFSW